MKLYGVFIISDVGDGATLHTMCVDSKTGGNTKPCLYTEKEVADKFCAYMQSIWLSNTYKVIEWDIPYPTSKIY